MRRVFLTLAVLAGFGFAGAVAIVGFGLYNVSAQVGHWPGVSWVLHTTFRNSVALRAPSMEDAPDLSDPDLIALGAGHYATACTPCHAAPGEQRSATMQAMVPAPPHIDEAVAHWKPNEMHWIVENGIKMSGMPAWPAKERDDEVWSVVAYLTAVKVENAPTLPDVTGDTKSYCTACHERIGGRVPRLDILEPDYIAKKLRQYRDGTRPSGIMAQAASLVPTGEMAALTTGFSGRAAERDVADVDPVLLGRGEELARRGTRDIPTCLDCHGGDAANRRGPAVAGQPEAFLKVQMELWHDGIYDADPLMHAAARELTEEDIEALAAYFSRLQP